MHVFCATTLWHDKVWVKGDHGEPMCKSFNTPDIPALSSGIKNKRARTGKHVLTANLLLVWIDVLFSFWQPHVFHHLRSCRWLIYKIKPEQSSSLIYFFHTNTKNQSPVIPAQCFRSFVVFTKFLFFLLRAVDPTSLADRSQRWEPVNRDKNFTTGSGRPSKGGGSPQW